MSHYEPYNEAIAPPMDRIAWALCQIIDDDAPMRWTRYRSAAVCIATNKELMRDLAALAKPKPSPLEIIAGVERNAWKPAINAARKEPPACNQGNLCPWTQESADNRWQSSCTRCGLKAQGSGQ